MPARAYTIPISPKLATAYNNETFPVLETRLMNGRVWLTTSRFIRGNDFTKAVLISVPSSWLEVSTKVVTFAEAMPLVHGVSYSKESQPFGSIKFPESALKRTQRKVTSFPSCYENQTGGEGVRKTPASTEQPVMDLINDYQESVNLP